MNITYRIIVPFRDAMYDMDPPGGGDELRIYDEVEKTLDDVLTMIRKELDKD
jgi:hypothetical protein